MSDRITELENKVDFLESYIRMMLQSGVKMHGDDYLFTGMDGKFKAKCMQMFASYMNGSTKPLSEYGKKLEAEINSHENADFESKTLN